MSINNKLGIVYTYCHIKLIQQSLSRYYIIASIKKWKFQKYLLSMIVPFVNII
jgi:hypothetical protein